MHSTCNRPTKPESRYFASLRKLAICAALLITLFFTPTHATWYREDIEDGADIMMMDLRWPYWPSGSYFANWNSSFNPKPNNLSFYAGFTSFLKDGENQKPNPDPELQDSFRPGSVWTFWGSDQQGTPVRFVDVAPNLYIKNDYGGEGSSGTTGAHVWPFVKRNEWYTMVARVWRPTPESNALVGRWIKDQATGQWHMVGIAQLPIPATSFTGNSGFLEPLTSEKAVRSLHRRFGYYRKDGGWKSSNAISIDKTDYVVVNTIPEGDHEYTAIEYAQRPDNLPLLLTGAPIDGKSLHTFAAKQPPKPSLDVPELESVSAVASGGYVAVSWELSSRSTPSLAFDIDLFDDPQCEGIPIATRNIVMPNSRHALVPIEDTPSGKWPLAVRIRMKDVFDQFSSYKQAPIAAVKIRAPEPLNERTTPGLHYRLWTKDEKRKFNYFNPPSQQPDEQHAWIHLDELHTGRLAREGVARGFDSSIRNERDQGFAIEYSGFINIPTDGPYIFNAQIDGAYRIKLDSETLLERDEQHGTTEKATARILAQGHHKIEVTYLVDQLPALNFNLSMEGPGIAKRPIALEDLCTPWLDEVPAIDLQASSHGDGTARIDVDATAGSIPVKQTQLFLDRWQLLSMNASALRYEGPLMRGEGSLWARITLENGHTFDTPAKTIENAGPDIRSPWTVRNVGDLNSTAGVWQNEKNQFQFFGSGMHTVTQKVSGDFLVECHVDQFNGAKGEPVNRRAWVGLTARENGERRNWEWGRDFHLVQTASDGLRASADFTDFGAGRISSYELPQNHPWLRIARKGDIWTAWSSPDKRNWRLGALQYKKMSSEVDVGLFFSALPQDARAHYYATVSSLVIDQDPGHQPSLPQVQAAVDTGSDRWTGIVVAPSDPRTLVVRSNHRGLVLSRDGGDTWKSINGSLTGDDLCVRSVAFDPLDAQVLFRATGKSGTGKLWKSNDTGSTWVQLPFDGDFDGQGPSALCGEIIAMDLRFPNRLFVGCETQGLFRSDDGGQSFSKLGCEGERITSVVVWPWEKHYPAPAKGKMHLCVTTCSDPWMELIGRGAPNSKTEEIASKSYITRDDGKSIALSEQRVDCGFYNVAFDKAMQSTNEMRYATSHGYQTQVFEGWHMALYPPQKNLDWFRPCTAIAASAKGDEKFGRFITGSLNPMQPQRYSVSERWAFEWDWMTPKPTVNQSELPSGGLIAIACDPKQGAVWYFLHTDGLYASVDGGRSIRKVLE